MPEIVIRPLAEQDIAAYRALRLEALTDSPSSFSASAEEETLMSDEAMAARAVPAPPDVVFGAFDGDRLIGMAAYVADTGAKKRHKAMMVAVYAQPEYRGARVGRRLVEAVIEHARSLGVVLRCTVVMESTAARRLYHALGFTPYGVEEAAICVDGRYLDEELLVIDLRHDARHSTSRQF